MTLILFLSTGEGAPLKNQSTRKLAPNAQARARETKERAGTRGEILFLDRSALRFSIPTSPAPAPGNSTDVSTSFLHSKAKSPPVQKEAMMG